MATEVRHGGVGALRLAADSGDEARMQQRQVDGGDERDLRIDRLQPGEDPLQRAAALVRILDDAHARGQRGQLLPGRTHDHDRPAAPRATIPQTRRSSVEPCQSSHAFGVPMRLERPPASTIPAAMRRAYKGWPDASRVSGRALRGLGCGVAHEPLRLGLRRLRRRADRDSELHRGLLGPDLQTPTRPGDR